jgi:hypothetical protein
MDLPIDTELTGPELIKKLLISSELRNIPDPYDKAVILYDTGCFTIRSIVSELPIKQTTFHDYYHKRYQNSKGRPHLMTPEQIKILKTWIIEQCNANKSKSAKKIAQKVFRFDNLINIIFR